MLPILDAESLGATLWNLEEARFVGISAGAADVMGALDWVATRQGAEGSYRGALFAPAPLDRSDGRITPTGENNSPSGAAVRHVLGEEAARSLMKWGRTAGYDHERVWHAIGTRFGYCETGSLEGLDGRFCCARCSVAWWRALEAGRPAGWEDVLVGGIGMLNRDRGANQRWPRYPFYYTLLTLAEMPLSEARNELKAVRPAVERASARQQTSDQYGRIRRHALGLALSL